MTTKRLTPGGVESSPTANNTNMMNTTFPCGPPNHSHALQAGGVREVISDTLSETAGRPTCVGRRVQIYSSGGGRDVWPGVAFRDECDDGGDYRPWKRQRLTPVGVDSSPTADTSGMMSTAFPPGLPAQHPAKDLCGECFASHEVPSAPVGPDYCHLGIALGRCGACQAGLGPAGLRPLCWGCQSSWATASPAVLGDYFALCGECDDDGDCRPGKRPAFMREVCGRCNGAWAERTASGAPGDWDICIACFGALRKVCVSCNGAWARMSSSGPAGTWDICRDCHEVVLASLGSTQKVCVSCNGAWARVGAPGASGTWDKCRDCHAAVREVCVSCNGDWAQTFSTGSPGILDVCCACDKSARDASLVPPSPPVTVVESYELPPIPVPCRQCWLGLGPRSRSSPTNYAESSSPTNCADSHDNYAGYTIGEWHGRRSALVSELRTLLTARRRRRLGLRGVHLQSLLAVRRRRRLGLSDLRQGCVVSVDMSSYADMPSERLCGVIDYVVSRDELYWRRRARKLETAWSVASLFSLVPGGILGTTRSLACLVYCFVYKMRRSGPSAKFVGFVFK